MNHNCDLKLQQYFQNNKEGHYNPYTIHNDKLNLDIFVYYNAMSDIGINFMDLQIHDIINQFIEAVNPDRSAKRKIIKINVFNDKEDYMHVGQCAHLGNEGGMHYYRGEDNLNSEIYVFQRGNIINLKHEIVHALCSYINCGKVFLPTVLCEGIAEFFAHLSDNNRDFWNKRINVTREIIENNNLTIDNVFDMTYSKDPKENSFIYSLGHVLVYYLQEKDQYFCKKLLECSYYDDQKAFLLRNIDSMEDFSVWLSENVLKNSIGDMGDDISDTFYYKPYTEEISDYSSDYCII